MAPLHCIATESSTGSRTRKIHRELRQQSLHWRGNSIPLISQIILIGDPSASQSVK